ncbi:DUF6279 family lipoprotein [Bdellovibrio reynosensis]|uniref:DUF6279 family lipoprotein n=1 Tax=Bdellovibrio reynosensis TaxID=2835041 RepID=A0ABY4CCW3_9BACT|nr:DUF6279 family lipoprotein [Bdellovibrio reynosensis]UOF01556.1 DUF6279 family lipoprotein [Bdellovibrio reynosensis]
MIKYVLVLLLGFLVLPSCSRLDLAFNWADTFIVSKVDDYFNLTYTQSKELKKSLNKDFKKVSATVIPQIIDDAKKLEQQLQKNTVDEAIIEKLFSMGQNVFEDFYAQFSVTAVEFIASTNKNQLEHFKKAFYEKQNEEKEKLADFKEYQEEQKEKYHKYFKMFLGPLNTEQKALIDNHLRNFPYPKALKLKNKEAVFNAFIQAVHQSPEKAQQFIVQFTQKPQSFNLPEYQEALKNYNRGLKKLIISMASTLNADQKKELRHNLLEKVSQLQKIRSVAEMS